MCCSGDPQPVPTAAGGGPAPRAMSTFLPASSGCLSRTRGSAGPTRTGSSSPSPAQGHRVGELPREGVGVSRGQPSCSPHLADTLSPLSRSRGATPEQELVGRPELSLGEARRSPERRDPVTTLEVAAAGYGYPRHAVPRHAGGPRAGTGGSVGGRTGPSDALQRCPWHRREGLHRCAPRASGTSPEPPVHATGCLKHHRRPYPTRRSTILHSPPSAGWDALRTPQTVPQPGDAAGGRRTQPPPAPLRHKPCHSSPKTAHRSRSIPRSALLSPADPRRGGWWFRGGVPPLQHPACGSSARSRADKAAFDALTADKQNSSRRGGVMGGVRGLQPRPRPRGGADGPRRSPERRWGVDESGGGGPEKLRAGVGGSRKTLPGREGAALRGDGGGQQRGPPRRSALPPPHPPTGAANAAVLGGFWHLHGASHVVGFAAAWGCGEAPPVKVIFSKKPRKGFFFSHELLIEPEAKAGTGREGG